LNDHKKQCKKIDKKVSNSTPNDIIAGMTTYILAGGGMRTSPPEIQTKLAAVLQRSIDEPFRVAAIFYGELREVWEEKFKSRHDMYQMMFGDDAQIRLTTPETFANDIAWANVIYLHGGLMANIAQYLDEISNLEELFAGKVVIGDSAGAVYLAKYAWEAWTDERVARGRGLVPVAVIPHFGSKVYDNDETTIDWEAGKDELAAKTDLPIYAISEGNFETFEEKS